jgi:two-component system, NtrC family, sensor histidine kinase HydH
MLELQAMWKHGILSAVIVAIIWLASSLVTTTYLWWLEGSYETSLQRNLVSIDAADALREDVWRLHAVLRPTASRGHVVASAPVIEARIRANLQKLQTAAATPEKQAIVTELRELIGNIGPGTRIKPPANNSGNRRNDAGLATLSWAEQISAKADQVSAIDHRLLADAARRRLEIGSSVLRSRFIAILIGPLLGIVLGWWLSRRLVRTVAQIRVTLTGTVVGSDGDLGTVEFSGKDDLAFIQQQIETVVDRLRRTANDLQQAREDVLRSERLAAIGGLAAGVAHELRNPLTSVKLLLQHAASRPGDAVLPVAKLRLILDEVARMEGTIQGLLDFSRPPVLQTVRHDLCETVRRAANIVEGRAMAQGVNLDVELSAFPVIVDGDPQRLHQVFVNLLINGIEAMPRGGSLRIHLRLDGAKSRVCARVEDHGSGIPAEILPRLFEPFTTSKERGTGLGLAVSRRIVEEHGGVIEARNRPDGGATFEVELPCQATAGQGDALHPGPITADTQAALLAAGETSSPASDERARLSASLET